MNGAQLKNDKSKWNLAAKSVFHKWAGGTANVQLLFRAWRMQRCSYPTDLTDEEWNQIKSLVPAGKSGKGKRGRPIKLDRRNFVNAIFYIVRSDCAWRLLPKDFGPWQTVYGYYRRRSQDWTWTFIHDTLRDWLRKTEG